MTKPVSLTLKHQNSPEFEALMVALECKHWTKEEEAAFEQAWKLHMLGGADMTRIEKTTGDDHIMLTIHPSEDFLQHCAEFGVKP